MSRWNFEYEICIGKKTEFPKPSWRFKRVVKSEETLEIEKKTAKKCKSEEQND